MAGAARALGVAEFSYRCSRMSWSTARIQIGAQQEANTQLREKIAGLPRHWSSSTQANEESLERLREMRLAVWLRTR